MTAILVRLGEVEQALIAPTKEAVVSIVDVRSRVEAIAWPAMRLANVVQRAGDDSVPLEYIDLGVSELPGGHLLREQEINLFEDTVLFSRCLTRWIEKGTPNTMKEAVNAYESLRRSRIEDAFEESKNVVKTVSDAGWLGHKIKTFIVPWYLWFSRTNREKHFLEDVTTTDIGY